MTSNRFGRALLATIILAIPGCTNRQSDEDETSSAKAVVAVRVSSVIRSNVDVVVTATGKTDALTKVKVVSPIAGRIQSLNAVEGTVVRSGEILATVQSREANAAIAGAEAMLQAARTPEERSEAERTLRLAQSTQNAVNVYARFNGCIATRAVNAGEFVAENAELMTLVDLATVVFVADVQLRDLPSIRSGEQCTVQFPALAGRLFRGRLDAIYPQSSEQSQTVKVRIRFTERTADQRMLLRTDMAGVASIVVGQHRDALVVPRSAVLRNDETSTHTVVVVTPDSLARIIPVTVGVTTDSTAEVASRELSAGMTVIVEGNYALGDSTRVTVEAPEKR